MRGDRPRLPHYHRVFARFTPHARGSTFLLGFVRSAPIVYPACAGIDLDVSCFPILASSLPRMRGDRPQLLQYWKELDKFTRHARGSTEEGARR